jgi:DNA-binding NarL/FixJ family response regulator
MQRIRVLIVDEHLAVRQALATRLGAFPIIEVVATACTLPEALQQANRHHPDVILMELKGASLGQDPVGEMSRALGGQTVGIIVLTSYADDDEREWALRAGAKRYLLKHIDSAHLLDEIERVAAEVKEPDSREAQS